MKIIHHALDIIEAQMLSGMLNNEGVSATVNGLNLQGAVGELPPMDLLNIAVADQDEHRAKALIADYLSARIIDADVVD